jgi:hypothetical protein
VLRAVDRGSTDDLASGERASRVARHLVWRVSVGLKACDRGWVGQPDCDAPCAVRRAVGAMRVVARR